MKSIQPNYKLIYEDIISRKYPHKKEKCNSLLNKDSLSALDIIKLNGIIFNKSDKETSLFNHKLRSYDRAAILKILDYQKANNLNNIQLANKFKISKNTVTKWRKIFLV